jgi:hypothetical protein
MMGQVEEGSMHLLQSDWTDIPGFEGRYAVDSQGRVLSYKLMEGCLSGPKRNYKTVFLGRGNARLVHRLVAETFLGPGPGLDVNHINGNSLDNRAENLEWTTRSENLKHAYATGLAPSRKGHNWGRKGEAHHAKKLTEDDVRLIRANPDGVLAKDLAKRFGASKAMITKIRKGMAWSHVA